MSASAPILRFVASELTTSPMLRFLATEALSVTGFCLGLMIFWRTPVVLIVMVAPVAMGSAAALGLVPAFLATVIPACVTTVSARKAIVIAISVATVLLSGIAGYHFGEALAGI